MIPSSWTANYWGAFLLPMRFQLKGHLLKVG